MNAGNSDRLAWGDSLFFYLEREGMPLNIASVSIFEGEITLAACRQSIQSKLPLLPRYQQRAVAPPLNVGFPTWEKDPHFDIRNHIREVILKRGTETELKAVAGKILSTVMDRHRPLWDLTLVHGLQSNRTALVVRIHHCLADGIAGLGLMSILMDSSPEPRPLPKIKRRRRFQRQTSGPPLLESWINKSSNFIEQFLTAESDILKVAERIVGGDEWPADELAQYLPELTAPTERLCFNITYQGPQKFAWVKIPLADIKAIREKCGGTHNDVVLALMTATIRRYSELHGDKVKGRLLRMMVPVSVRGEDSAKDLGNRISILPVTVPLDIRSPRKLLVAVRDRMDFLKRAHIAELVGLTGGLVSLVPAPLQAVAGPFASLLPITPFNMVCTNIRGPQSPLYLLGHKMLDFYPYVPVGGEMALNCAVLSYNDVTYFGFSGDVHAAPDLRRLEDFLKLSFKELQQAAAIRPAPRKKTARPKPVSEPRAPVQVLPSASTSSSEPANVQRSAPKKEHVPADMAAD